MKLISVFLYHLSIALPPSEPRNLTVDSHFYVDQEVIKFTLNISWKGPEFPQGSIKHYRVLINSTSASFIDRNVSVSTKRLCTYV